LSADATQLASKIRLLLMDVDGVLTDGKIYNVPEPDGSIFEPRPSTPRTASACNGWRAWE